MKKYSLEQLAPIKFGHVLEMLTVVHQCVKWGFAISQAHSTDKVPDAVSCVWHWWHVAVSSMSCLTSMTCCQVSVNEAAAQLCRHVPTLLTRRNDLFPLARQVVRDSGYQYSKGRSRWGHGVNVRSLQWYSSTVWAIETALNYQWYAVGLQRKWGPNIPKPKSERCIKFQKEVATPYHLCEIGVWQLTQFGCMSYFFINTKRCFFT